MAIEVFNRYEKKYLLTDEQFSQIQSKIIEFMDPDKFNKNGQAYSICNLYYDTENDELIRNSIEKPTYKEKLRLRGYGIPQLQDTVYLEIKKKFNGKVNKRRSSFTLEEAYKYIDNQKYPLQKSKPNIQVLKELEYFLNFYKLQPKVYIYYERFAYFAKNDNDFRITFDTNIKTRRTDLQLEKGANGSTLLPENMWLMEAKSSNSFPLWFCKLLSDNKIYSSSFSKYGTEYKNYLINTMR